MPELANGLDFLVRFETYQGLAPTPRAFFICSPGSPALPRADRTDHSGRGPSCASCLPRLTAPARPPCPSEKGIMTQDSEKCNDNVETRQNARNSGQVRDKRQPKRLNSQRKTANVAANIKDMQMSPSRTVIDGDLASLAIRCYVLDTRVTISDQGISRMGILSLRLLPLQPSASSRPAAPTALSTPSAGSSGL